MRQADQDVTDLVLHQKILAGPRYVDDGFAEIIPADFEVGPLQVASPAGAERFKDGFLGCPSAGKVLRCPCLAVTVIYFMLREDALQEMIAMPGNNFADAGTFNDVSTQAEDVHGVIMIFLLQTSVSV